MENLERSSIEYGFSLDAQTNTAEWAALKQFISHPYIALGDDWQLLIKKSDVRSDKSQYRIFDFKEFYLPPTEWHKPGMTFVDRPKFAGGIVLAAQDYFLRVPKIAKGTSEKVVKIISDLAKFFEYCWLEGIYDPNDVTDDFWLEMYEKLTVGGWGNVLRIRERIDQFVLQNDIETLRNELVRPPALGRYSLNVPAMKKALSTNASVDLLSHNAWSLYEKAQLPSRKKNLQPQASYPGSKPLSVFECLQSIANLSFIPDPYRIEAAADVDICRQRASSAGRTKNIQVDDVAEMLSNSMFWIDKVGPVVCSALEAVAVDVATHRIHDQPDPGKSIDEHIARIAPQIANIIPDVRLSTRDIPDIAEGTLSFRDLIVILDLACFVMIAGLNARRRDEVCSSTIGLYRSGSRVEDEILGVYSAEFYLEKSLSNYKTYYIGKATYAAISLLNNFFDSYQIADAAIGNNRNWEDPKEEKLFSYRRFSIYTGIAKEPSWFSLDDAIRQGKIIYLTGKEKLEFDFRPHTLRRFYALIFYYRFEHGTLQALMYQLGDDSMNGVLAYITDPNSRPELEAIDAALNGSFIKFHSLKNPRLAETLAALQEVGNEKLSEIIEAAILGKASGGYAKYIRRLDLHLVKTVDYKGEELNARVRILNNAVHAVGHWPKPKPHGDCLAGGENASKIAHCATEDKKSLQPENASPKTCSRCPFSYVSHGYYRHMNDDLIKLKSRMDLERLEPFEKKKLQREIENLEEALALHAKRLGGEQ